MTRLALFTMLFSSITLALQVDIYAMRHNCWWRDPCRHEHICKHQERDH